MRLGIDAREIQNGVYTGIGRPLVNFLTYFAAQEDNHSCVLFSVKKIPIDFGPKVCNVIIPSSLTFIWDQWHLPLAVKREGVSVFYSPYYKIPLLNPCKSICAILDLMYIAYGPYYKRMPLMAKCYYAVFGRLFAYRANKIVTCSQFSKRDIIRIYGVQKDKIVVIPLSVAHVYFNPLDLRQVESIKRRNNIDSRYILYLGNFKLHKNVALLIHAFAAMALEFTDLKLVLAGPLSDSYPQLVKLVKDKGLDGKVVFTGKILESDGPQYLYQGAEVFVMVSCFEGFGLPPLEAMACGVPVVASNTTSIPEILGQAGILVDPDDVEETTEAIKRILRDPALKQELVGKGLLCAKKYESTQLARQMLEFIKTVDNS